MRFGTRSIIPGLLLMLIGVADTAHAQTLYVYLHTPLKTRALEDLLKQALPGVDVRAFGRLRDFEKEQSKNPADAVLARTPVLEKLGLKPSIQGQQGGRAEEPLVALSLEPVEAKSITQLDLGTLDLLGRRSTSEYFGVLLGASGKMSCKRVTKVEDLLPLLQFKSAQAVLVAKRDAEAIRKKTKLDLVETKLSVGIGLPAFAFPSGSGGGLEKALLGLPAAVSAKVGVDAWRSSR